MMKFLRHVLSHLMFLILISGIVAIYYFRSQVMPAEYVGKINHYAEKIHPAVLEFKHAQQQVLVSNAREQQDVIMISDKQIDVAEEVAKAEEKDAVEDDPVAKAITISEPVEILKKEEVITPVSIAPAVQNNTGTENMPVDVPVADKVVTELAIAGLVVSAVPVAAEKAAKTEKIKTEKTTKVAAEKTKPVEYVVVAKEIKKPVAVKSAVIESTDVAAADYKMMLQSARSLFQNRKYKESISKYKELIELENHEADFHGELGNVYYGAGNWSMAGKAYYEAAIRLMDKGDLSQVSYLQRVLQGLDKDRAYKLAQLMSAKSQEK